MSFYTFNKANIIIPLAFIIFAFILFRNRGSVSIQLSKMHGYILAFMIYSFASSIWAIDRYEAIVKGQTIFEIFIIIAVLYSYYSKIEDSFNKLLKIMMFGGYGVVIYSFITYGYKLIMSTILGAGRLDFLFIGVNSIGAVTAITLILSIYFLLFDGFTVMHLMSIPTLLLLVASGSRRSIVTLMLGLLIVYMFYVRKGHNKNILLRLLVIVVLPTLLIWVVRTGLFSGVSERMIKMISNESSMDSSSRLRKEFIKLGIYIFKKNPFLGIGMGCARIINKATFGIDAYLHNNYVELLANGGLFGFILFYLPYAYIINKCYKYRKINYEKCMLVLLFVIILLINDIGVVSYYSKETYFVWMVLFIGIEQMNKQVSGNLGGKDIERY